MYLYRDNIRPTNEALTIGAGGFKERSWSLIPSWAREPRLKFATFNARAETVTGKPAFRGAWKKSQRCIVPATAYGEWPVIDGEKRRHRLRLKNDRPFMFAGLWEDWSMDNELRHSFTIITSPPVDQISWVHHRMPLMLRDEDIDQWLHASPEECEELLQPQYVGSIVVEPVS